MVYFNFARDLEITALALNFSYFFKLSSALGRYENISKRDSQKLFLDVLTHTVKSFIAEIKHKASVEHIRPESQCYCSIMNGVFYLHYILKEWSNDIVSKIYTSTFCILYYKHLFLKCFFRFCLQKY